MPPETGSAMIRPSLCRSHILAAERKGAMPQKRGLRQLPAVGEPRMIGDLRSKIDYVLGPSMTGGMRK